MNPVLLSLALSVLVTFSVGCMSEVGGPDPAPTPYVDPGDSAYLCETLDSAPLVLEVQKGGIVYCSAFEDGSASCCYPKGWDGGGP
jgi:hypothetical protein